MTMVPLILIREKKSTAVTYNTKKVKNTKRYDVHFCFQVLLSHQGVLISLRLSGNKSFTWLPRRDGLVVIFMCGLPLRNSHLVTR